MPRTLKGVTLSEAEKAQAGYSPGAQTSSADPTPNEHSCTVTLPDGRPCHVNYRRLWAQSHEFSYQQPLCQTIYFGAPLGGNIAAIEAKAKELLDTAYRKAQEAERKQMCTKPATKSAAVKRKDTGPDMSASNAEKLAGKYAACLKCKSGHVIRVGPVYDTPEQVTEEIASGRFRSIRLMNGQELVVGICNRQAQCWQEPQFLAAAKPVPEDQEDQDPDDEEELANQLPDEDDLE